ncbi:MAG: phosphatase PAP2 family protein [bacterium]
MKNKTIILSFLILIFLIITFFVINQNTFIINLDNIINNFMGNNQIPYINKTMSSITKIGDVYETFIIFIIFGLFLILKNKKKFYIFTFATFLGIISTEIIKHLIQKVRPYNLIEQGFSFPSAHTVIATIFLFSSIFLLLPMMKENFLKKVFLLIISIIFPLIAFSRIYLSFHWTSDVFAGIILGLICFIFAKIIIKD